jgi:hypothetical protein
MSMVEDFEKHLIAAGRSKVTVKNYVSAVRGFLKFVGTQPLDSLSEETTRAYFDQFKGQTRMQYATAISQFLIFSTAKLPALVNARGAETPPAVRLTDKEIELRRGWAVAKLVEQKESGDDLIAKLARKVIDFYLYAQNRLAGEPDNLDDLVRYADECKELIESNLKLFMGLSAGGRNIHSAIDERVKK